MSKEQRTTRQRLAIERALDSLEDFVSAQELHRLLRTREVAISLATTYRILQSLASEGYVDVLHAPSGEAIYRQCAATSHHHHVLCRQCGKAVEVESSFLERWADETARHHGFTDIRHSLEITGLCPRCAQKALQQPPKDLTSAERAH